jgi:hypothetical protein
MKLAVTSHQPVELSSWEWNDDVADGRNCCRCAVDAATISTRQLAKAPSRYLLSAQNPNKMLDSCVQSLLSVAKGVCLFWIWHGTTVCRREAAAAPPVEVAAQQDDSTEEEEEQEQELGELHHQQEEQEEVAGAGAAPLAGASLIPEGWTEAVSRTTGQRYFVNTLT